MQDDGDLARPNVTRTLTATPTFADGWASTSDESVLRRTKVSPVTITGTKDG